MIARCLAAVRAPYNGDMQTRTSPDPTAAIACSASFADHDFGQVIGTLEPDATMTALLPSGFREWAGAPTIGAAFENWFGNTPSYEVIDTTLGPIGELLSLRWRLRLLAERFGDAPMVVEQRAYAAIGPSGRIARISLLCSGFQRQQTSAEGD